PQGTWRDFVAARWARVLFAPPAEPAPVDGAPAAPAAAAGFAQPAEGEAPVDPTASSEFQRWWEQTLAAGFAVHPSYDAAVEPVVTGRIAFNEAPALAGSGALDLVTFVHP